MTMSLAYFALICIFLEGRYITTNFSVPMHILNYFLNVTEDGEMEQVIFKFSWDRDFLIHIRTETKPHQDGHKYLSLQMGIRPDNTELQVKKNRLPSEEYARLPHMTMSESREFLETICASVVDSSKNDMVWNSIESPPPDEEEWQIWMVMEYDVWTTGLERSMPIVGSIQGVFSKNQPIKYVPIVTCPYTNQYLCFETISPRYLNFRITFLMKYIQCCPLYEIVKRNICYWVSQQPHMDFSMNLPTSLTIQLQEKYDMYSYIVERFADDDKTFYKELFRAVSLYI